MPGDTSYVCVGRAGQRDVGHAEGSFEPHPYHRGRLDLERGIGAATGDALAALGHRVQWLPDLSFGAAGVCAIVADRSRGVLYHCDAVQAAGKVAIDVRKLPADYLSLTGHKFHAPKGIGALYVRRQAPFSPLIHGGHQERNRRGGTESVPLIVGLSKAAELARKHCAWQPNTASSWSAAQPPSC